MNWTADIIYSEVLLVVSNKHFIGCKIPVYRDLIAWIITVNMVHMRAKKTAKIKSEIIEIKHLQVKHIVSVKEIFPKHSELTGN